MKRKIRAGLTGLMVVMLSLMFGQPAGAVATLSFPYVDRPNTAYSFKIDGTIAGPLFSYASPNGTGKQEEVNRNFTTLANVTTGPLRRDDTFELNLKGETSWVSLPGTTNPSGSFISKYTYRFVLDRAGRIVRSDAPGTEPGRTFNAWDFLWSALARVRPKSTPRRVTPGTAWVEEYSTSQTLESMTVRTSFKSDFIFARLERFRGRNAALLTEKGTGMITTYKPSQNSPTQTRVETAGRIWADPSTGLIRYAEWTARTQPVLSTKEPRPTSAGGSSSLSLTCTLVSTSIR